MLIFSLLVTGPEAKTKVLKTTLMLPKVQNAFLKKTSYF
jgi:hypothetical protein